MLVISVVAALVAYELSRPHIGRWAFAAAAGVALALWEPLIVAFSIVLAAAMMGRQRLVDRRLEAKRADDDVTLLAELVQLGLAAGLTFPAALDGAAEEVDVVLRAEVRQALRRARAGGLEPILADDGGRARPFFAMAAQAGVTGAPLLPAVDAFVQEQMQEERTRRQAAARRLPVRLLVPVALLILPGFVVLTVAPALLGAFERLRF